MSRVRCPSLQDAAWARTVALPPLQSVIEMTSAYKPPARGEEPAMDMVSSSAGQPPSLCLDSNLGSACKVNFWAASGMGKAALIMPGK